MDKNGGAHDGCIRNNGELSVSINLKANFLPSALESGACQKSVQFE